MLIFISFLSCTSEQQEASTKMDSVASKESTEQIVKNDQIMEKPKKNHEQIRKSVTLNEHWTRYRSYRAFRVT